MANSKKHDGGKDRKGVCFMKTVIVLVFLTVLSFPVFCLVVKSDELTSRYGISQTERANSNYIEKDGYSFHYLGNGTWEVNSLSSSSASKENNDIMGVIILIIHAGIAFLIYKKKGLNYALSYFFLIPLLSLIWKLGKKGGVRGTIIRSDLQGGAG